MSRKTNIVCRNVFKNKDDKELILNYTKKWIKIINFIAKCRNS